MSDSDNVFALDPMDLTLGEMDMIEEVTGVGFEEAYQNLGKKGPKAKILMAMALVVKRRENPDTTLDDVKGLKILVETPDPKE